MDNLDEEIEYKKKTFWKDGKNIAIIILSVILLCTIFVIPSRNTDEDIAQYERKISELNKKIEVLNDQIKTLTSTINVKEKTTDNLNKENTSKKEEISNNSTNQNNQQNEIKKTTESVQQTTSTEKSSSKTTNTNNNNTNVSSSPTTNSNDNQSEMVWVGETGSKYHYQDCRTLQGKGHQITLKQALAEGRQPCKVCH